MTEPTNPQSFSGTASPLEKPMDEGQLLFCAIRALLFSAFIMIFLGAVGGEVYRGTHSSVGSMLALALAGTICAYIGFAIPMFGLWGCAVAIGHRLNWLFDKPLNPSAIAALAANFAFLVPVMYVSAALEFFNSAFGIAFLFVGSLLFQSTARIAVTRKIAHHNALAGRKLYIEPPCQVQFQIRQLLILTLLFAVGLAIAQSSPVKTALPNLLPLMGISAAMMAAAFYPAILASASFSKKFGKVRLKSWERGRCDENASLIEPEYTQVNSLSNTEAEVNKLQALVTPTPKYQKNTLKTFILDECTTAVNWISCSGGIFAMGVLIIVEISRATHHGADFFSSNLAGAILVGIPGLVCIWILSAMMHGVLWTLFERLCKPGTLAAITGGTIGALGTFLMLGAIELVHFNHLGFISLDANNLFPLAMVLYGSLVGQAMGRMGIKVHRYRAGFSEEEYQALATDSPRARSTWLQPLLLSTFCWCIFLAVNGETAQSISNALLEILTGVTGCMFAVWPLANILVRFTRVAPKPQAMPQPASFRSAPISTSSENPLQI